MLDSIYHMMFKLFVTRFYSENIKILPYIWNVMGVIS